MEPAKPPATAGAAMEALQAQRAFPSWALFAYKALKAASDGNPPLRLALVADDAILLAPTKRAEGWVGFFICQHTAAGHVRTFVDTSDNSVIQLQVPVRFENEATTAEEAVMLPNAQGHA